jgi:DNA-binding Lrp family transcriptional regulator
MARYRLFVLAKCNLGEAEAVGNHIADQIPEVAEVYSITGDHDLLLKIPFDDVGEVQDIVQHKLHRIPGLRETQTMLSFRVYGEDIGDFVS